jgi:hypothetical protein
MVYGNLDSAFESFEVRHGTDCSLEYIYNECKKNLFTYYRLLDLILSLNFNKCEDDINFNYYEFPKQVIDSLYSPFEYTNMFDSFKSEKDMVDFLDKSIHIYYYLIRCKMLQN